MEGSKRKRKVILVVQPFNEAKIKEKAVLVGKFKPKHFKPKPQITAEMQELFEASANRVNKVFQDVNG